MFCNLKTFWPFLMVVSITERMTANSLASCCVLNCPDIFCLTLMLRMALSDPSLSKGTQWCCRKVKRLPFSYAMRL